jgi:uncharacterized protein YrrD
VNHVERIDKFIGRQVVSLETANNLGDVADLLINPLSGELAGLAVKRTVEDNEALVSIRDVHGLGPDAVIVESEECLVLAAASPLNTLPRVTVDLKDVKVITEHGQLLGNIANLFLCLHESPIFIYEVRSSLVDKLLGRAFYFAASLGCAFSDDRSALVVTGNPEQMDHRVQDAAERLLGSSRSTASRTMGVHVEVRSHAQ